MTTYVCVYLGSALLAVVGTPLVIRLACRIGAVDRPGPRAVHKQPVPRIGGVAIFSSAMCLIVAVLFLDNVIGEAFRTVRVPLTVLLCSATFIFLIGLVDDLKGLSAKRKLLAELAAASALCLVGVRIDSVAITHDVMLHMGGWGSLLTLFWIVGITNAVNLSDGLDGLAAGISALACGTIAAFAIHGGDPILSVLMLALVGSLSGFLFFNFNPARVFMGDCGSLFLGFTIAASSVMCVAKSATIVGLTLPALALGVPIFDTLFAMLRRFLEGRSLFAPDRSHFHHRLLDLGLHQRQAVLMIYFVTLLAAGFGLFMLVREDVGSLLIFGCVLLLITLLFRAVGVVRLRETVIRLKERLACSQRGREEKRVFEQLQLRVRQVESPDEGWRTICQAAQQLGLAWVSLHVTKTDGSTEVFVWRRPGDQPRFTHVVTMSFPLTTGLGGGSAEFEIAVLINRSLESANHRAGLFSRLVDEYVARNPRVVCKTTGRDTRLGRLDDIPHGHSNSPSRDELWQRIDAR
ncbi:MAG: undecaprenyl/decaprenyl-phosphate alpha-N-acetylglucosaminyl 1-phosphate transferase [Sedimentisphaerales bacterium]|nr:undecaprenyl/decaprenyl-phosphate alpha-N-acetylglucosaminyl 1-phosphate transferase [Sedimentisphaerales bacterium]